MQQVTQSENENKQGGDMSLVVTKYFRVEIYIR